MFDAKKCDLGEMRPILDREVVANWPIVAVEFWIKGRKHESSSAMNANSRGAKKVFAISQGMNDGD